MSLPPPPIPNQDQDEDEERESAVQELTFGLCVLSCSITPDAERLEKVIAELAGKDLNELIALGAAKLASVPSGGGGGSAAAG